MELLCGKVCNKCFEKLLYKAVVNLIRAHASISAHQA